MASDDHSLEDRARRADKIVREPGKYKICEGCDSIVSAKVVTCPNCHSYRFEANHQSIIKQAKYLSQRQQNSVLLSDLE